MNSTVNGIGGISSLGTSALSNAGEAQDTTLDAVDWFSASLASSGQIISPSSNFDAGISLDQIAQQIVSHICNPQGS